MVMRSVAKPISDQIRDPASAFCVRDVEGRVHAKTRTPNSPTAFRFDRRWRWDSMSPSIESINAEPRPFISRKIGAILLRSISGTWQFLSNKSVVFWL